MTKDPYAKISAAFFILSFVCVFAGFGTAALIAAIASVVFLLHQLGEDARG